MGLWAGWRCRAWAQSRWPQYLIWAELGLILGHRRWVGEALAKATVGQRLRQLLAFSPGRPGTSATSMILQTLTKRFWQRASFEGSATGFPRGASYCVPA